MKFEMSLALLEEIALCIVHNNLDEDEACEYVKNIAIESTGTKTYCDHCNGGGCCRCNDTGLKLC